MKPSYELIIALCKIINSPTSSINGDNLAEHFGVTGQNLIKSGALKEIAPRHDMPMLCDHEGRSVEVVRHNGKNCYFSPTSGWVEVSSSALQLYSFCADWLVSRFKEVLAIESHVKTRAIMGNAAWDLGEARLMRTKQPIILVTQLRKGRIFSAIVAYLNERHKKKPALLIALDHQLPSYLSLPSQNRYVLLGDVLARNDKDFALNFDYLVEVMGASIKRPGFSNGYRTAMIEGQEYSFTKKQADAIEMMDKAGKPLHQDEIMAEVGSNQKLIGLFRSKGTSHPAWNVIIKGDGKGSYWLEY
ncbi:hypothetical protein [Bartonella sp. DGB2]|uniref:hypothetical protein n=1 Tax=Bartonella sp. DGB2 TaxID=3388426 RepID=UPI00398FD64C